MLRTIALVAAVGLVLLSGAVAGVLTNRWGLSLTTDEAAARLREVPLELPGWDVSDLPPLSDAEVRQAEMAGYLSRRYRDRKTGASFNVLVMCGRPGPISVHTPDVCYKNSGWAQTGRSKFALPEGPFEFDVLDMRKQDATLPAQLRLYMAMGSKGAWSVPKRPRVAFAGQSALFKVYVIQEAPKLPEAADQGPATELLKALMPQLQQKLFPAS